MLFRPRDILIFTAISTFDINDQLPRPHELLRDLYGRGQQSARIVPKIQDGGLELLFPQLLESPAQILRRRFLKLGQPNVANVVVDNLGSDTLDFNDIPDQREHQGVRGSFALDRETHFRAFGPPHALNCVHERQIFRRLLVDLGNEIPCSDASLVRRGPLNRSDHCQPVVLDTDLNADPAELPFGLNLNFFVHLWGHIGRVRIERGQHAPDRPLD